MDEYPSRGSIWIQVYDWMGSIVYHIVCKDEKEKIHCGTAPLLWCKGLLFSCGDGRLVLALKTVGRAGKAPESGLKDKTTLNIPGFNAWLSTTPDIQAIICHNIR